MGSLITITKNKSIDFKKPKYWKIPENPWLKGIAKGRIYVGPKSVQVDITNNCNMNCVGCWCHSDLMGDQKFSGKWKQQEMKFSKLAELVDDLSLLGTEEIQLAGSGDPTMHTGFMQIIEYIKKKGLRLTIITNFSLMDEDKIKKLIQWGVDSVTVSLWAGDAKTYKITHPNQHEKTFEKIKRNLKLLHILKGDKALPTIKIYNVISCLNYSTIEKMVDFAIETKTENIEFQIVDTVEGKTDHLALNKNQSQEVMRQFTLLKRREDYFGEHIKNPFLLDDLPKIHKSELSEFGIFISGISKGFKINLNENYAFCPHKRKSLITNIPDSIRQAIGSNKNNIYLIFSKGTCNSCFSNKEGKIKIEFLNLLGYGTFSRRISSTYPEKAVYETRIIDTLPCYIGWTFARVLVNGDVVPCCKGFKMPLGNIYGASFRNIWKSEQYKKFRLMAVKTKKMHPYFNQINCRKSCDNVGMNLHTDFALRRYEE